MNSNYLLLLCDVTNHIITKGGFSMAQAKIIGILKTLPDGTQKYDTTAAIIESNIRSGIIPNVINSRPCLKN